MAKMKVCKYCNQTVAGSAKVCPHCGGKLKKKWFTSLMAIVGIGCIAIGIAAGPAPENTPTLVETTAPTEGVTVVAPTSAPSVFAVGDAVAYKDFKITWLDMTTSTGAGYYKPTEGKVWIVCEFEIENVGDNQMTVSYTDFSADVDGYMIEVDIMGHIALDQNTYSLTEILPGKKARGTIVFEADPSWEVLTIFYQPNMFINDGVTFSTLNN